MPKRARNGFELEAKGVRSAGGTISARWASHAPRDAAQGQPANAAWATPDVRRVLEAVQQDNNPLAVNPSRKIWLLSGGVTQAVKKLQIRIHQCRDRERKNRALLGAHMWNRHCQEAFLEWLRTPEKRRSDPQSSGGGVPAIVDAVGLPAIKDKDASVAESASKNKGGDKDNGEGASESGSQSSSDSSSDSSSEDKAQEKEEAEKGEQVQESDQEETSTKGSKETPVLTEQMVMEHPLYENLSQQCDEVVQDNTALQEEVWSLRERLKNSEKQKNALQEENAQLREQVESLTSKKQKKALEEELDLARSQGPSGGGATDPEAVNSMRQQLEAA